MQSNTKFKKIDISIREDHTLAVTVKGKKESTLVFHDLGRSGGKIYYMFHPKTTIRWEGNRAIVRTPVISGESGAPIKGLIVTYTFTFDEELEAFYLSADYGCEQRFTDIELRLMDVSWENMTAERFTGYDLDAEGKPFVKCFDMPPKNPDGLDYMEKVVIHNPTVYERTKTQPHGFKKAVAISGEGRSFCVYGGTPIFEVEAEFVSVFPDFAEFLGGDYRFFSGANAPGAWFIFEKADDMFELFEKLDSKTPLLSVNGLPFETERITLLSGELKITLLKTEGGVFTCADGCQPMPLFNIDLWDTQFNKGYKLDSGEGWSKVDVLQKKNFLRITLSDPDCGRASGITVFADAYCDPKLNRISWRTRVVNLSERWSISQMTYPQLVTGGYDTLFLTVGSGVEYKDFTRTFSCQQAKHPVGVKTPMGFTAVYNENGKGIYMGVHDPECTMKFFGIAGAAQTDSCFLSVRVPLPYQHKAGNSFTMPGELVYQSFDGDWFDATRIYREFVHTKASWFPKLRGRTDSPEWIRKCPVWIMHFLPNENPDANPVPINLRDIYPDKTTEDWYNTAIRFRKEIGVPTAYHVYNWHWVPFNNDNPHYFPARPDFKKGVKLLKDADIKVVPYVSGYSWDRHDNRGDDFRFEKEAMPASAKNMSGETIVNAHASTEPNGIRVQFARMCPTTAFWKEELRHLVHRLYTDYKVDGIYLDVISAAYNMCCDENHLHPKGYGSYWWKAYAELIEGLRKDVPPEFAMTSESNSEVYAESLDAFLSWTWVLPDQVPAFPYVYGGRIVNFGRVISPTKRDDDVYFRYQTAEAFAYGQQLGWIHPEIVDDEKQFPILKKLANLRWQYADFFTVAEMLRPPVVGGKLELVDTSPYLRGKFMNHHKAVVAAGWEDEDQNRKLFVINSSLSEAEVTVAVPENEYNLPNNIGEFEFSDGVELISQTSENGKTTLTLKLAPLGVVVVGWNGDDRK